MPKVTIITADQLIIVDGRPVKLPFTMAGEWAVQFNGVTAEVEYTDSRQNEVISEADFTARYGHLIEAHATEAARLDAEAEAARIAAEQEAAAATEQPAA